MALFVASAADLSTGCVEASSHLLWLYLKKKGQVFQKLSYFEVKHDRIFLIEKFGVGRVFRNHNHESK